MNNIIEETIRQSTIFVVGQNEKIRKENIDYIFSLPNVEYYILVKPSQEVYEYFTSVTGGSNVILVDNYSQIEDKFKNYNVIAFGLNLIDTEFQKKFKGTQKTILLFFEAIGIMRSNWEKNFKNIQIIDKSFINFSIQFNPQKTVKIEQNDLTKTYFENRGKEKDQHLSFLVNNTKKACKIVGMEGIGKKAFVNELKKNYGLVPSDSLFIEYNFYSPNDTLEDLIIYFAAELKINAQNIFMANADSYKISEIVKNIVLEIDKFKNVRVIFNNLHLIYDSKNRKFINNGINAFFNKLIKSNSDSNKKIYFLSNVDIKIGFIEDYDLIETILLLPMKAYHIKLIISKFFGDKQNHELAQKVFDLQDDLLNSLIGGHPQIAKLFVKACENIPFDLIINDENFRLKFEISYKVQYLIEKIAIEQYEYVVLNHMAFLKENVGATIEFFKFLDSNFIQTIEVLKSKFLIESQIKDNTEIYYMPSLIKNFIHGKLKLDYAEYNYQEYVQNCHQKIGDYFWNFGEKFETDFLQAEEYYRLALYHFVESKNFEKLQLFVLRFKPTIFEIAKHYYYSRKPQQAYDILEEVYKVDKLMPGKLLVIYLECEFIVSKKSVSKIETRKKYEDALIEYEGDEAISASFARFLFNIQSLNESKEKCEGLLECYPLNFKVRNTYPKVLYKLGDKTGAIREIEDWISILEKKFKSNNHIAFDLSNNYLTFSKFIESDLKDINHISIEVIKNIEPSDYPQALKILDETTYIFDEIINIATEKLLILPDCNIQSYNLIIEYVKQKQKPFLVERLAAIFSKKSNIANEADLEEIDTSSNIDEQTLELSRFTRKIKTSIDYLKNKNDNQGVVFSKTNILDKVTEQKKIAEQSLSKINRALEIAPNNFQALSFKIKNLINTEYLYLLDKIIYKYFTMNTEEVKDSDIDTIKVFLSYSHFDKAVFNEFKKHLSFFKRENICEVWSDNEIRPGELWNDMIFNNLLSANIIIFLVSANFIASDFCYNTELSISLERHKNGEAIVIPVIIKPCQWKDTPLGAIQALPKNGIPVIDSSWGNVDYAYNDVVEEIKKIIVEKPLSSHIRPSRTKPTRKA